MYLYPFLCLRQGTVKSYRCVPVPRSAAVSDFSLSFGRLESVLANHFRIDPDRAGTFRARIKQLQRLNFPSGVNVGRGVKFEYGLEHTLKLIVALEFMSAGLPAKFVSDIVENDWTRFLLAFQLVPPAWDDWKLSGQIYVKLDVDMFSDAPSTRDVAQVHDDDSLPTFVGRQGRPIMAVELSGVMHNFTQALKFISYDTSAITPILQAHDTGLRTMKSSKEAPWVWVHTSVIKEYRSALTSQREASGAC